METIPAKTILSAYMKKGWFGCNYNMNLYRGCPHGCIYCDSRSACYGIKRFDTPRAKENALAILARELKSKRRRGTILTGSMSDPYNPLESGLNLTRGALKLICGERFGVMILTKSNLILRDAELIQNIGRYAPAVAGLTITTADDALCKRVEPNVCATGDRFKAIQSLSRMGVMCGVLLMPLLPFINDTVENVRAIVQKAADSGARWVYAEPGLPVSIREGQREYFYARLDEGFGGLKEKYINRYGLSYWCYSPEPGLWEAFMSECEKKRLAYRQREIADLIALPYRCDQISLFDNM